jgi:hypothetical protein
MLLVKGWQEEVARTKQSLELMNSINHRPLKQDRDSLLRAVKDVAKTAKKFGDNSNGRKYWLYFQDLCGNYALNDDKAVVLLSIFVCEHQMGPIWFASTVRPLKEKRGHEEQFLSKFWKEEQFLELIDLLSPERKSTVLYEPLHDQTATE